VNLAVRKCLHLLPDDFAIDNAREWQERVVGGGTS
jgi:hypothetical protein